MIYDRFSLYYVEPAKNDEPEMARVPETELQALIEFANLAKAAGPANCNHPADTLDPFELVVDACVCGECGAVLKNYGNREAAALGLEPGWNRLTAELLTAEIRRAFKGAIDLLEYIQVQTGDWGSVHDVLSWSNMVYRQNDTAKILDKVR